MPLVPAGLGAQLKVQVTDVLFADASLTQSVTVKTNTTPTLDPSTGTVSWASQTEVTQNVIIANYSTAEIAASSGKITGSDVKMFIQKTSALTAMSLLYTVELDSKPYGVESFKRHSMFEVQPEMWEVQLRER